jgi:hypothetical protein
MTFIGSLDDEKAAFLTPGPAVIHPVRSSWPVQATTPSSSAAATAPMPGRIRTA